MTVTGQVRDGPAWYVVATKPGQEADAVLNLRKQGHVALWFRHWETTRSRRRTVTALRPVFANYIFTTIDESAGQSAHGVNATRGVLGLVVMDGQPATIRDAELWRIRAVCDPAGVIEPGPRAMKQLRKLVRQKVMPKVPGLDFDDILARIEKVDETGRFRLSVA